MSWEGAWKYHQDRNLKEEGQWSPSQEAEAYVRDRAWDMHERVDLVEEAEDAKVPLQKELLESHFCHRKEEAQRCVVFDGQDIDAVLLSQLSHLVASISRVQRCSNLLGHRVCHIIQGPVEHLNQERKLLQNARRKVHPCRVLGPWHRRCASLDVNAIFRCRSIGTR